VNQDDKLKQIIREEYKRCAIDCIHFFRKYGIIQHPKRGKIHFDLYDFQEVTLDQFQKHRYTIVLKGRQLGLSTLAAAYALWKMIFTDDFKVLVIATTQDVAKELLLKVQLMYLNLPVWIRKTAQKDVFNKLELTFQNGSAIKAVSSSEKSARSPSISLLLIDEAAFIDQMDEIWRASQATLSTGGDCIMLSTPNGQGNLFHKVWMQATEEFADVLDDPFNPILLPWSLHPDRGEDFKKREMSKLGKRGFAQEHDCDFVSSGHTVIEGHIIQWYKDTHVTDPIEKRYSGDMWLWEYPNYSKDYIVSADVARGDGEDYSAFTIFDVETMVQVAGYKAKIGTREYGNLLVSVGIEWNNALLVIDNKNMGWDVVQVALDRAYPNLYYSYKNDPFFDENIHLRKNIDLKNKKDMVPGFTTGHKARISMISKLEIYFREKGVTIKSIRVVNELFVFLWINGKAQAQSGYNDDLISTIGMAFFVRDTALRLRSVGIELTKRALGQTHKSIYLPKREGGSEWEQKLGGNKGTSDLRWLLNK
tara:strand:- start:1498 stop:3099 length:1602 start_codon:yes stop_codon:yes gene_type:complete